MTKPKSKTTAIVITIISLFFSQPSLAQRNTNQTPISTSEAVNQIGKTLTQSKKTKEKPTKNSKEKSKINIDYLQKYESEKDLDAPEIEISIFFLFKTY